jgi:hypothetical protein
MANSYYETLVAGQRGINEPKDSPMPEGQVPPQQEQEQEVEEKPNPDEKFPEWLTSAILEADLYYEREDWGARQVMVAFWKKLENYWDGMQRIFWDFQGTDWQRIDIDNTLDPTLYDKIINMYRAHGESLVAALTIKLPNVIFYPEDADVTEDIDTARAYSKISELVARHNNNILLFIKAVYTLFNQGVVAAYIYNRHSSEYGTVKIPTYGPDINVHTLTATCPLCNDVIGQEQVIGDAQPEQIQEEMMCENCQAPVSPNVDTQSEQLPHITGYTDESKSRTIIEVFGPMYAHMPLYARNQQTMPYIRLRFEQHENLLKELYPDFADKISGQGGRYAYDRWARAFQTQQGYEGQRNLSTTTCVWLRPWAFNCLADKDVIEKIKKEYPHGVYAVIVNDSLVVDVRDEALDEHWEISVNPTSNYLHADPLGKTLAPVQELYTEVNDLALETFEHAIPETFVDPDVLNLTKYQEAEAKPGMIYPAKPKPGKNLGESFFSLKTATLNEEIEGFKKNLEIAGQFVSGSFPSIYGGPAQSGSKTASEYSESRAMALQRLNTTWTLLKYWHAGVMSKAVVQYAKDLIEDEKIVNQAQNETGFINILIKKEQLAGKVGRVEPDAEEELPTSFAQVKGVVMELIGLNNEHINEALFHPQNSPIIKRAIGIPDAYIPGEADRDKQFSEFAELLKSGPLPTGQPSVMPDIDVDDNIIHIETCKAFLVSPSGLAIKRLNPMGYANIIAHLKMHEMAQMQLTAEPTSTKPGEKPDSATERVRT